LAAQPGGTDETRLHDDTLWLEDERRKLPLEQQSPAVIVGRISL